jgi:hypothetical protein
MKRLNLYLDEERLDFLKTRGGSLSEHIRWAIEIYINGIQKEDRKSTSSSKSKVGDKDE